MDDLFLVKQILGGNREAYRFLVLRYERPIFAFLGTFQLTQALIEEIAQDTFLRAFKDLKSYDPSKGATFSSWLFVIAKNLAINELGRASRKNESLSDDGLPVESVATVPPAPSQEAALIEGEQKKRLTSALNRLSPEYRNALVLSYLQELSLEEVAQIENCSLGTVKSRIFRGKQVLRSLLLKSVGCEEV